MAELFSVPPCETTVLRLWDLHSALQRALATEPDLRFNPECRALAERAASSFVTAFTAYLPTEAATQQ